MNQQSEECRRIRAAFTAESEDDPLNTDRLEIHLEECDDCRAGIEADAADPELWEQLRAHLRPTEFDVAGAGDFSAATCSGESAGQLTAVQDVLDLLAPTDDPHKLGRLGPYEISGVIGIGGMGVVLKAVDPSLERVVAVKVLAPSLAHNEKARLRFAREAKAAAAVLHPNVVPIHSVSGDGVVPFLVMSYIRGGSLQKRLESEGPLPIVETLRISSQIAAGLTAAHEQGLIHRDIKPENILLEEGVERVTITDFGLARAVDDTSVTRQGTIAGTPRYMSPEQARGEQLDQSSDLFSLGSVMYALCTGRPPYTAETSYGVMRKIIDESPAPIRDLNPEVPPWLAGIVGRLMARDKADRLGSSAEVHELLEACLSHVQQPSVNPLPPQVKQSHRGSRRRMLLPAALTAVAVAVAASGIPWMLSQSYRSALAARGEKHVRQPLERLRSYITAMMTSPNTLVFLNLGDIGQNKNYLVLQPTDDGIVMRIPAEGASDQAREQAVQAAKLRELAMTRDLEVRENSDIGTDGSVNGITFEIEVAGEPAEVAVQITDLICSALQVSRTEECRFQFANMPSSFATREGERPRTVSAEEFVRSLREGSHVYLGEQENLIYGIPKVRTDRQPIDWNSEILRTDVRDLSPDAADAFRNSHPKQAAEATEKASDQLSDLSDIQGTWQVVSAMDSGRSSPPELIREMHIEIGPATLTLVAQDGSQTVSEYVLDPASVPRSIDLAENGRMKKGIYELHGDRLKICLAEHSDSRPTAFRSAADSVNDVVINAQRVVHETGSADIRDTEEASHRAPEAQPASVAVPQPPAAGRNEPLDEPGPESGLFEISVNGQFGFINNQGGIVIRPQFDQVYPFSEGLAAARLNEQWGFINMTGKFVIEPQFRMVRSFSNGRAAVRATEFTEPWGYIDPTGRTVIEARYDCAEDFRAGIARVGMQTANSRLLTYIADIGVECDERYIDRNGNEVPKPNPSYYAEGDPDRLVPIIENGLTGYVNSAGEIVIAPRFQSGTEFSESLACVCHEGLFGFIDRSGKFVIPPAYSHANAFSEGLAGVQLPGNQWGFINREGRMVIPAGYDWIYGGFREGLGKVTVGGRIGYINKQGAWVW